jgi:hypothetical protein
MYCSVIFFKKCVDSLFLLKYLLKMKCLTETRTFFIMHGVTFYRNVYELHTFYQWATG